MAAATFVSPRSTRAQTPSPSPSGSTAKKPVLVPPVQLSSTTPPYPDGGEGDADVVLSLRIGKDGSVTRVEVVEGAPPFDAAAAAHAKSWRFAPATRDGAPITAQITARVHFIAPHREPVAEPTPDTSASAAASASGAPSNAGTPALAPTKADDGRAGTAPPSSSPPKPPAVIDVEVSAHRVELGTTVMGASEVRTLPGAFGDPFRAIESMPGVSTIASGLPFFFIRGAPPGDSGYYIDGIRVPLLFHVGAGPSVLAAGMIDQIDFQPGAYPAQYGRVIGGVVAGITKDPSEHMRGEWNLRLFDVSGLFETPLDKEGKTNVLVAGRYGYPGLLLTLVQSQVGLQYWDYQARISHKASERDRLSAFVFGAYDDLTDKAHDNQTIYGAQFHRLDLRWDHRLDAGSLRMATTLMFDRTNGGDTSTPGAAYSTMVTGFGVRAELEEALSSTMRLRAGADWTERHYSIDAGNADVDTAAAFPTRNDMEAGVRADVVWKPTANLQVVPGIRFDAFGQNHVIATAVDPRLATAIKLDKKLTWITMVGLAHQAPAFPIPIPGLDPATLSNGLQEVLQTSTGVEWQLPEKSSVKLTAFWHRFLKTSDVFSVCNYGQSSAEFAQGNTSCDIDSRSDGHTYGLELLAKRDLSNRFGGWLSYTLSTSPRQFRTADGLTVNTLSDYDRTHVLALVLGYDLGKGWRAGARGSYNTGRPQSATVYGPVQAASSGLPLSTQYYADARVRLPDFFRLDVRLEKRWELGQGRYYAVTFEWFDALIAKEAIAFQNCPVPGTAVTPSNGQFGAPGALACQVQQIGPVTIPSIGFEGAL